VAVAAVVVAMALWLERPATATEHVRAAPFTVTNLDDSGAYELDGLVVDETGDVDDGDTSPGHLSLREAIKTANFTTGADTITFAPNVTGTIVLASQLPIITTNVTIQGPGATSLTISGNNGSRVFLINSGAT
jgi:hypothetical protein